MNYLTVRKCFEYRATPPPVYVNLKSARIIEKTKDYDAIKHIAKPVSKMF